MDVLMPQLGETVAEGKITQWFKSAGDAIKPGDNLFEIETDKVSMEVPATAAGVLAEIRVPAGAVAPVGAVVAVISDGARCSACAAGAPPPQAPQVHMPSASQPDDRSHGRRSGTMPRRRQRDPQSSSIRSSRCARPRAITARRDWLAAGASRRWRGGSRRKAGIDLTQASPRVRTAASSRATSRPHARPRRAPTIAAAPAAGQAPMRSSPSIATCRFVRCRSTACAAPSPTAWSQAKQTIPHFYLTADVEIARLIALREEANADALKDKRRQSRLQALGERSAHQGLGGGAGARAGRQMRCGHGSHPAFAAFRYRRRRRARRRLDRACDPAAELKTLSAISNEMKDLAARARASKLDPSEYQGGSSTISNLGMYGVREFSAIINPPQATLLAVGAARRQPVEDEDGGIAFTSMLSVTLSCDHRVVDGALGAELLAAFRELVEQPVTMLV